MKQLRQLYRLVHINYVFTKHGLDKVFLSIPLFVPIRFLAYFNPWNWSRRSEKNRGERIRFALEELGPVFVKFGQMLSTRSDLLPEDIIEELSKLQAHVPPFPSDMAKTIIEKEYQRPVKEIFAEFEMKPLASASVAQIHEATFHDGQEVVVKVLRPGIEKTIRRDVSLLYTLARLAERYWSQGRRFHLVEVIAEFEHSIIGELDLTREAASASQLRRNFADSDSLYVPEVYWPFARDKVMVMERIYGIPVSDIATLKEHGFNMKALAEQGVEIFFTQVFRDCFFHADMHPGNIFVNPTRPRVPQYIAVDFGIIGTLSPRDQHYLAENFMAFFKRDYRRVAELHIESAWVASDTRVDEFETDLRTVCEPIFERPLKDISFGRSLMRLFQVGRKFNMEVQPQLVLLQKTLLNVEGLGRSLYPDLDLWNTAKPFLEDWMRARLSPRRLINNIYEQIPYWADKFPELPGLIYDVLHRTKQVQQQQHKEVIRVSEFYKKEKRWRGILQGLGIGLLLMAITNFIFFDKNSMDQSLLMFLTAGVGIVGILFWLFSLLMPSYID